MLSFEKEAGMKWHRRYLSVTIPTWLAALWIGVPATPVAAQFGIRGGMNLTKFVGGDAGENEASTGLNLGASIPILRIGPLSIVPEVYYSEKGSKQFDPMTSTTFEYGLNYIEVPVLAKLSFPLKGALRGYVTGGPAYAWNIDCTITATESETTNTLGECGETFSSFDTAMEKADRGVVIGGGLDFTVRGLGALNLDARIVRGLARLKSGNTGSDIKNQAFTLMLGYYIGR
jgi:hypothetical protein